MTYKSQAIQDFQELPVTPESLSNFCDKNGMSRTVLAKILGVATNTVTNWENGLTDPPAYLGLALKELQRRIYNRQRESGF